MSDHNNMPILDRFMRDAAAGADVWYMSFDELAREHGFVLYEPTAEGKPWTWISGPELADELVRFVPQAVQTWKIPGETGLQFLEEMAAQP